MHAKYHSGNYNTVDGIAGGDIAAGDVIVISETCRIAHLPIAAGELGAFADGGGLYYVECLDTAGIVNGSRVYWDDANDGVSKDPTSGGATFGYAAEDGTVGNLFLCRHVPSAPAS